MDAEAWPARSSLGDGDRLCGRLVVSACLGGRFLAVPVDWRALGKLALATAAICPVLLVGRAVNKVLDLLLLMAAAGLVYGTLLLLLNVGGVRPKVLDLMGRWRHES